MCGGHAFKAGAPETMEILTEDVPMEGLRLRALRLHTRGDFADGLRINIGHRGVTTAVSICHERAVSGAAGDKVVTIVAEHDNRLLGMATGLAADSPAHDELNPTMVAVFVDDTVLGPPHVGRLRLFVWITSGNEPAVALYRRCGFRATGAATPPRTRLLLSNARCCWNF